MSFYTAFTEKCGAVFGGAKVKVFICLNPVVTTFALVTTGLVTAALVITLPFASACC